jgi:hypothetical protein
MRVRPEYVLYMMGTTRLSKPDGGFGATSLWYPPPRPAIARALPARPLVERAGSGGCHRRRVIEHMSLV